MEKRIKNFEDYSITEDGKVVSYKNKKPRILKSFVTRNGYEYVDLSDNGSTTRFAIHRLVVTYYVQGYFENAVVNHIDGNTLNNYYTNLEWCSQKENIHKGYETSKMDAVRNYCYHIIEYPNGYKTQLFKGQQPIKDYIKEHNLDTSFSSLLRHGQSRGFKLHTLH